MNALFALIGNNSAKKSSNNLSSDKNYTGGYKVYAAHLGIFGTMSHALRWLRTGGKFRRISRRQASQLPRWCDIPAAWAPQRPTPFFTSAAADAARRCQPRSLQGGIEPSRHRAGPSSRLTAPGLSSCVMALPAPHPETNHTAMRRLTTLFTVPPSLPIRHARFTDHAAHLERTKRWKDSRGTRVSL